MKLSLSRAALLAEFTAVTVVVALAAASVPWSTGYLAWSWDALNHHVYLGMTAEYPRWQLDVLAANFQSYQYPYLYWPVYRLSLLDAPGAMVGAAWSAFQAALLAMPVWCISWRLLPALNGSVQIVGERLAACALAFMSGVVIIGLETTANDVLAAVPLLWAVFVGLQPRPSLRQALVAAFLCGVSVAFKLSNGIFLPLLVVWWWQRDRPHLGLGRGLTLAIGACLGFTLAYGPWGWQLWRLTGNPFHPFFGSYFGGG